MHVGVEVSGAFAYSETGVSFYAGASNSTL